MDGADTGVALFAEIIARFLDVLSRAAEGDENSLGIFGLVFGDDAVVASGQAAKFFVSVLKKREDWLIEIVAARDDTIHVVFLILHRAEEDWVFEVHHFGDAAALWAKEFALGWSGAIDDVSGIAEVLAEEIGFGGKIGALGMGGEHAVLDVHARIERDLVAFAQDDRLIGGLRTRLVAWESTRSDCGDAPCSNASSLASRRAIPADGS